MRSARESRDSKGVGGIFFARPGAVHHRLRRPVLRAADQGGGVAPARVPRRRLGGAVHAQPGRHRRRARPDPRASGGALIAARCAEDLSHMFFGQSVRVWMRRPVRHPPAARRAHRARQPALPGPGLPGQAAGRGGGRRARACPEGAAGFAGEAAPAGRRARDAGAAWGRTPDRARSWSARSTPASSTTPRSLLAALPAPLREALREPEGASAAMVVAADRAQGRRHGEAARRGRRGEHLCRAHARACCRSPAASASAFTCR